MLTTPEADEHVVERRKLSTRVMAGRAFMIKTPPCEEYLRNMTTWLTTGSHGALVMGRPRLGKTLATRWVLSALPQLLGYLPWLEVPIRNQRIASEREFFQHVLRSAKHRHYLEGTAGDKRDRLAEWLVARARRSSVNTFVLAFDEAHTLTNDHLLWLMNIGNELDQRGYRLFCLLVGQSELADKKIKLIDEGMEQIVGRFMVREMRFRGICTCDELSACFERFHSTIYPADSALLFPEHFIPLAVSGGFKLPDLAPAAWASFDKLWSSAGFSGPPVLAMHYLTAALIGILNSLVKEDSVMLKVRSEIIDRCVRESGYLESLRALRGSLADSAEHY